MEQVMGNKKARNYTLQAQHVADWERVRTDPRYAVDDVFAPGIGLRRLQLIVRPSFDPSSAWEIRQLDADWSLFKSSVVPDTEPIQLVGYDVVPFDPMQLSSYFNTIVSLSLPLARLEEVICGADGTLTQLAIFGGFTEVRFQWWSEFPPQWKSLIDIADEMAAAFSRADHA